MTSAKQSLGARELDVLLYGATGYTGRLVARELEARGLRFAVSGRSREKLEALRRSLASGPEAIAVDLSDRVELERQAGRAAVLLTCAGPFAIHGKPVQDAALAAGTHYVDVTGEHGFMLETWRRDSEARKAGVVLLNAAGFDVVPTDLCAWLASRGLEQPQLVEIAIGTSGSGMSRGTLLSIIGILRREGLAYEDGEWRPAPPGLYCRDVPFPPPLGPRRAVSVPWGDLVTAPRSTGASSVRVYMATGTIGALVLRHGGRFLPALVDRFLAGPLERLAASQPEGPSDAERARTRFTIWAEATAEDGSRQFALLEGRDPYGLTAVTAAHFAGLLSRPGHGLSGALTPTQTGDPEALHEVLRASGVTSLSPEPGRGFDENP